MIVSILITLCISFIFGVIGYFTGGDIVRWFSISLVLQYVIFFIINSITKTLAQMHINRMEVERLNAIDQNKAKIECAVCGEPNEAFIKINENNEFRCERCKSLNSINVTISNYQKTEMLDNGIITEDVVNTLKNERDKN